MQAIETSGTQLTLNGVPTKFVGVNAYELATDWGVNEGCGAMLTDAQLNDFFASLPPNSLVRIWANQATLATNATTRALDWQPLQRVFSAAEANGQRLIVAIGGQGSGCDGYNWEDPSWYLGGYHNVIDLRNPHDGRLLTPLSYWDYVQRIVAHFKGSPALGMWEPMSEAEASTCPSADQPYDCSGHQMCPDEHAAAGALRSFFDSVGALIHRIDSVHLVESGLLGSGQCGTQGADYAYVSASPGIDVMSYHDYYAPDVALGGDQWNGESVRLAQAAQLDKPIIVGELGIEASSNRPGCPTPAARAARFGAKVRAAFAGGASAVLAWNYVPNSVTRGCTFDISHGDPMLSQLGSLAR